MNGKSSAAVGRQIIEQSYLAAAEVDGTTADGRKNKRVIRCSSTRPPPGFEQGLLEYIPCILL